MKFKMVHENYNVADLDKAMRFYEEALGLKELRRKTSDEHIIVYMGNDESDFELELTWLKDHPQKYDIGEEEFHLAFLAVVSLMPFSTSLLAEFITFRLALVVYWLNIVLLGATLFASWTYARAAGLVRADVPTEVASAMRRRIVIAQTLYAVGAALCVFGTTWSIAFIVLLQLNYAIAPNLPWLRRL